MTNVFNVDHVCLKQSKPILVYYNETTKTIYWNFLEFSSYFLFVKNNVQNGDEIKKESMLFFC